MQMFPEATIEEHLQKIEATSKTWLIRWRPVSTPWAIIEFRSDGRFYWCWDKKWTKILPGVSFHGTTVEIMHRAIQWFKRNRIEEWTVYKVKRPPEPKQKKVRETVDKSIGFKIKMGE